MVGSKVTPRIVGFLTVGTVVLSTMIGRSLLISLDKVVKWVEDDLGAKMRRFLSLNQLLMRVSRYLFSWVHMGSICLPELRTEESSAYCKMVVD